MNRALIRKLAVYLAAFALGGIFLSAAYPKIVDPVEFARIVYHYRMLGPSSTMSPLLANLLAVILPWVEAVTGVLLIVGIWRREAAIVTSLMLVMFLVAVGWAMSQGIDVENCGCFSVKKGEGGRGAGWGLLAGDTAMLAAAIFVAWASDRVGWTKPSESSPP